MSMIDPLWGGAGGGGDGGVLSGYGAARTPTPAPPHKGAGSAVLAVQ